MKETMAKMSYILGRQIDIKRFSKDKNKNYLEEVSGKIYQVKAKQQIIYCRKPNPR